MNECIDVACMMVVDFFFFKQKTAYEMRISDWSSDVCSSDLVDDEQWNQKPLLGLHGVAEAVVDGDVQPCGCEQPVEQVLHPAAVDAGEFVGRHHFDPIGRASGRESVCQYE